MSLDVGGAGSASDPCTSVCRVFPAQHSSLEWLPEGTLSPALSWVGSTLVPVVPVFGHLPTWPSPPRDLGQRNDIPWGSGWIQLNSLDLRRFLHPKTHRMKSSLEKNATQFQIEASLAAVGQEGSGCSGRQQVGWPCPQLSHTEPEGHSLP